LLAMMDDSKDEGALRLAGMAARALVIWPADEKVRAAFAAVVKTGYMKKGCFTQMQAYTYLTKYAPEEQKAVLMSEFAAQTPDNPVRAKAVEKLLERQAFDVLGKVIQESTGRTQSSLLYSLCQAAGSAPAGARKFAVEQMKKKLETKANPDELGINALPILKAEAGPLLPLLKALNSTNPGIVDAIAGIEAAVAAEGKK
jgi:hypothetical protein